MRSNSAARSLPLPSAFLFLWMLVFTILAVATPAQNPDNGQPLNAGQQKNVDDAIGFLKNDILPRLQDEEKELVKDAVDAIEKARKGKPGEKDPETEKPTPPKPGIKVDPGWGGDFGAATLPETIDKDGTNESTEKVMEGLEHVLLSARTAALDKELLAPILAHEGRRLIQKQKIKCPPTLEQFKQYLKNEIDALKVQLIVWREVKEILMARIAAAQPNPDPDDVRKLTLANIVEAQRMREKAAAEAQLMALGC